MQKPTSEYIEMSLKPLLRMDSDVKLNCCSVMDIITMFIADAWIRELILDGP